MNEDSINEFLHPETLTHDLLPPGETSPHLSASEFIKTTPSHELNNIFGIPHKETTAPKIPVRPFPENREAPQRSLKNLQENFSDISKKETMKQSRALPGEEVGIIKKIFKILLALVLILFILFIALYIWGALLQK
jgi:hypothetical protein